MPASDYHRIEKAIQFLAQNGDKQPSLASLSRFLGLSESRCHRLFRAWAGITPKDFLQFMTLSKAKSLLANSHSVLEVSHETGLSGSSRLHDLFIRTEAMTPGEYKSGGKGLEISWDVVESPMGQMAIAATSRGICFLSFVESMRSSARSPVRAVEKEIHAKWPRARIKRSRAAIRPIVKEIGARILGRKHRELTLHVHGTAFQVQVWDALMRIPEGDVTTYKKIAEFIERPTALRAVGTAVGANPVAYLIPCHRAILSTGVIGDYHWGSPRKSALLAIERSRKSRRPRPVTRVDRS